MASDYPASLDELRNDFANATLLKNNHAPAHNDVADALMAVQATLGTNPQGEAESVAARLTAIEGAEGGGGSGMFSDTIDIDHSDSPYDATAAGNKLIAVDASGGNVVINLPNDPEDGTIFGVVQVSDPGVHSVTIEPTERDVNGESSYALPAVQYGGACFVYAEGIAEAYSVLFKQDPSNSGGGGTTVAVGHGDPSGLVVFKPWSAGMSTFGGQIILPTTPNGHAYQASTPGTADTSEPDWPTDGTTVEDGAITWQDLGVLDVTVTREWTQETDFESPVLLTSPLRLSWASPASALSPSSYQGRACYAPIGGDDGTILVGGYDGVGTDCLMKSTDRGVTFSSSGQPLGVDGQTIADVAWGPTPAIFLCVGYNGGTVSGATSADGDTWTPRGDIFGGGGGACVIWDDDLDEFVLGGTFGTTAIQTTPDGVTYTPHTSPFDGGTVNGIAKNPDGTWVVTGADSEGNSLVCSGPDLDSLVEQSTPFDGAVQIVGRPIWSISQSKFFVGSTTSDSTGSLISSPDGETWTVVPNSLVGNQVVDIVDADGVLYACGNSTVHRGTIEKSYDGGATWRTVNNPTDGDYCSALLYVPTLDDLLLAVGEATGSGTAISVAHLSEAVADDDGIYTQYPGYVGLSGIWPNANAIYDPWDLSTGPPGQGSNGQEGSFSADGWPTNLGWDSYSGADGAMYWINLGSPVDPVVGDADSFYFDLDSGKLWLNNGDAETPDWIVVASPSSFPKGWTITPANESVDDVDISYGAISGEANGGTAWFSGDGVTLDGAGSAYMNRNGIVGAASNGGASFRASSSSGSDSAMDCGGLPIINLPTADPHIAGALYNLAGVPTISAG